MSKIHYATGGLITPEKSEFITLCGRKFPQGHDEIMQAGYLGAKNTTCKDCRKILDTIKTPQELEDEATDKMLKRIQQKNKAVKLTQKLLD